MNYTSGETTYPGCGIVRWSAPTSVPAFRQFSVAYWMSITETYQPPYLEAGDAVERSPLNAYLCDMDGQPPITTVTVTPPVQKTVPYGAIGGAEMAGVLGFGGLGAHTVRRRRWRGAGDPGTTTD